MELVQHLGRVARDRQTEQLPAVVGILRIARVHGAVAEVAAKAFNAISISELRAGTVLHFGPADMPAFKDVLVRWQSKAPEGDTKRTLDGLLQGQIA